MCYKKADNIQVVIRASITVFGPSLFLLNSTSSNSNPESIFTLNKLHIS